MRVFPRNNEVFVALRMGLRLMLGYRVLSFLFLAATVAQGFLQGMLVWVLREVLHTFSRGDQMAVASVLLSALVVLGVWTLRAVTTYFGELLSADLAHRVEIDSMVKVLNKLLGLSVQFFDKNSQGDLVMASYNDLKGARTLVSETGRLILYLTRLLGLGTAAALISPRLAFIGLVLAPVGILPAYWFGRRITREALRERDAVRGLHDSFLQISTGIKALKVNRSEARFAAEVQQIGADLHRYLVRKARYTGLARLLLEAVSGLGIILVLVFGGYDVAAGRMGWESLMSLLIAVMAVYAPVIGLIQIYGTISGVIPNLQRVERIFKTPELADRPGARALDRAPATITLQDVSFAYDDQTILESVSATFYAGETIGIVGPSGAGKSTLLSLLLRFYHPTAGAIRFDGVDIRDLRQADLMAMSAIVLQEPFLFMDTVANNIRVGRPEATRDEVVAAATAAGLHDEIMAMEDGYDTVLGRGSEARLVSGGQRQRISIAAALLKNTPMLFLDEATNSLDSLSERKVQAAIETLMRGRTTFVIAHRLSTLHNADRIIVLDRGRMVGLGAHSELLLTCETYRRLWEAQQGPAPAASPASPVEAPAPQIDAG